MSTSLGQERPHVMPGKEPEIRGPPQVENGEPKLHHPRPDACGEHRASQARHRQHERFGVESLGKQ